MKKILYMVINEKSFNAFIRDTFIETFDLKEKGHSVDIVDLI